MPIRIPEAAGDLYRPSNGTEGEMFQEQYCYRCRHDRDWREKEENPCDILTRTLWLGTEDPDYPVEWIYDPEGVPTCTAFEEDR